jgi:redox-regulated HSP33 family molecular chaperone
MAWECSICSKLSLSLPVKFSSTPTDIDEILEKEGRIEARCIFCGKVEQVEANEVMVRNEF